MKNEPSSSSFNPNGTPGANGQTNNSSPTITFLLTTEIIPLCLRIMETGSELSKTVAIFIVQKILLDDTGLGYICATYERFYAVGTVLSNMVVGLVETQTVRLLKHVVRCFLRYHPLLLLSGLRLTQIDSVTTTALARPYDNACRSLCATLHSPMSSEMMRPPSGAWHSSSSTSATQSATLRTTSSSENLASFF